MTLLTRFDPFYDFAGELFNGLQASTLKVDIAEKNGAYTVTAELPGVRKEDIRVDIDGTQVTLEAEVKREKDAAEGARVLYTERSFGKVARSFTLPQELDEAKVEAKFRDGVLELTLPKKAAAARKQITIQ
jgi:HSP20 family protein